MRSQGTDSISRRPDEASTTKMAFVVLPKKCGADLATKSSDLKIILKELVGELEVCFSPVHPVKVSSSSSNLRNISSYHVLS